MTLTQTALIQQEFQTTSRRSRLTTMPSVTHSLRHSLRKCSPRSNNSKIRMCDLSYLLQQNGLPTGSQPLADTRELSDVLPTK
jgi:hypothetical protein